MMSETHQEIDWTQFTRRIHINKPVQEVYNALAIPTQIEKWFLEKADYIQVNCEVRDKNTPYQRGDAYEWKWWGWEHIEKGVVLHANDTDHITFTFSGGKVDIKLKEDFSGTLIILKQRDIKTDETSKMKIYTSCSLGWSFWLVNLKAWLEHGITLNDKRKLDNPYAVVNA